MAYVYYPGCSLKGTGVSYEKSLLATFKRLNIPLQELDDWNCCGATSYMSISEEQALLLSARNLALASENGGDIIAPCSACYMILNRTANILRDDRTLRQKIVEKLKNVGLEHLDLSVRVRHPLDVLVNDVGLDTIRSAVVNKLTGLRVFPYYGCLIVRPGNGFDHPTYPTSLDRLLEALGCEVIDHPLKTRCCGGSLTGTLEEVGVRLVYILLKEAKKRGAHTLATLCALCQFNLDVYQEKAARKYNEAFDFPILFFTQLVAFALGANPRDIGLEHHFVPAEQVFEMVR